MAYPRCGSGGPRTFVEQIALHLEEVANFQNLDVDKLLDLVEFHYSNTATELISLNEQLDLSTTANPNLTNQVEFEIKVVDQNNATTQDWNSAPMIRVHQNSTIYFRWSANEYQQCLPFLQDNGKYALTNRNQTMLTGNTESEGYALIPQTATYHIECGGQRNGEYGVDERSINVILN